MSIKDRIAIVGVGCTKFGESFHKSYDDLIVDAAYEAFEDAKIGPEEVQAAWLSTAFPDAGVFKGRSGMDLAEPLALFDIPITRVSNYCASGQDALKNACAAVMSGDVKVALALGVEKLRDRPPRDSLVAMTVNGGHPFFQKGVTAPGQFAILATRHFHTFGTTKEHLALISVKNHRNGARNPLAHYQAEVSLETVLRAPPVAEPLGVLDCCPTTDGAAAAIVVRTEDARSFRDDYVTVKGLGFAVGAGYDSPFYDPGYDFVHYRAAQVASRAAYEQAGIKNPRQELDLAEVHDCFSIAELIAYEDLGFCEKGQGGRFIAEGRPTLEGDLPVNTSGGLLSFGHPIGATGLRMIYHITKELQGKAGSLQVKNAHLGLAYNLGGPGAVAAVTILGI
ncbi:MAG: acetyl-CoA acetyltransferase [Dehalococcoidia bacterium]|nr:acetyl-CoA acetyltransferase [Dehalococcoidia bacterium]